MQNPTTAIKIDTDTLDEIFHLAAAARRAIRFHLVDGSTVTMETPTWSVNEGARFEGWLEGRPVRVRTSDVARVSLPRQIFAGYSTEDAHLDDLEA